jgi:tRNA A-37 threonylcarbamoyl transferase component Bud32
MSLTDVINSELAAHHARIRPVDYGGRRYWVKRRERLGLRMRLQKGNAARSFDIEQAALRSLAARSLPVPAVVASGDDWLAIEDAGTSLADILRRKGDPDLAPFRAGGQALAQLHNDHVSHGRPAIKDILWDGNRITFIDFERYSDAHGTPRWHAIDVIVFVHSLLSIGRGPTPELDAATEAYRENGGTETWRNAKKLCRRMGWIRYLLAPILRLRRADRGKDVRAVVMTLEYFAETSGD